MCWLDACDRGYCLPIQAAFSPNTTVLYSNTAPPTRESALRYSSAGGGGDAQVIISAMMSGLLTKAFAS
jgi:hypothetical protein